MEPGVNIVCDRPNSRTWVVRFARPDLRAVLYDTTPISDCELYQEVRTAALGKLDAGETLVVNFGLLEWLPSIFFVMLLEMRNEVAAKHAKLVLCNFPPLIRESFDVMGGSRLFDVRATEARAVSEANK